MDALELVCNILKDLPKNDHYQAGEILSHVSAHLQPGDRNPFTRNSRVGCVLESSVEKHFPEWYDEAFHG